jgi:hypothetical protein
VFLLKKSEKIMKTKLRGAVLLLVLTVMFMLMILLMATLAMVSSSNQKAYVKFEENQAFYSAASALEVFWDGALSDNAFLAADSGGALKDYIKEDGNTAPGVLTQGRELELELYKLAPLSPFGGLTTADIAAKIDGGTVTDAEDLIDFFSKTTDKEDFAASPNDYGKQFVMDTAEPKEIAFFVEYPAVTSPTAGGFGRYADINPNAGTDKAPQVATIKIEVIDRFYDVTGVDYTTLMAYLDPAVPLTGTGSLPVPAAIGMTDGSNKIDMAKLTQTLHQSGDRTKDHFDIRVTAESMLMGVKGSAAVELKSSAPVVAAPAADTAIKSFGFTEDGGSGYNAVGGATGLSDMTVAMGNVSGMLYSEGNIVFDSTGAVTGEDSMQYKATGAEGAYIVSKPHIYSKSWIYNANVQTFKHQGSEMFIYASKGIYLKSDFTTDTSFKRHFITNGTLMHNSSLTINGNLVMGEFGKANTFQTEIDKKLTVNNGMYVHDLYFDDLASGASLQDKSFGMNADQFIVGEGEIYVRNLYLNFPSSMVINPTTEIGTINADGLQESETTVSGYYDNNHNDPDDAGVSPVNTQNGPRWIINSNFGGTTPKLIVSGKVYFRNYGAGDPWIGREWGDIDGTGTGKTFDSWFTIINGDISGIAASGTPGVRTVTPAAVEYHQAGDASFYNDANNNKYAWDINPDVSNAINSYDVSYNSYRTGQANSEEPQIDRGINDPTGDPSKAPYSFDQESGHVWLRMPFIVTDNEATTHTARAILKFDTPMSLYQDFFTSATVFQDGTRVDPASPAPPAPQIMIVPRDGNDDRYLTYDPALGTSNPDELGYGMVLNKYVGAYTVAFIGDDATGGTSDLGTYTLPSPTPGINDDAQRRYTTPSQGFGYLFSHIVGVGPTAVEYGVRDLVLSAEEKATAAAFAYTNVIFNETDIQTSLQTTTIPSTNPIGPSLTYTKKLATDGVVPYGLPDAEPYRFIYTPDSTSIVNVVDAVSSGRTILLQPKAGTDQIIEGTYVVDGDNPVNFIIPGGLGAVELGSQGGARLNIISSKNYKYFTLSTSAVSHGGTPLTLSKLNSITDSTTVVETGSRANAATKTTASKITLYVGQGTHIRLRSGVIDGTVYAPDSFVTFWANQSPNMDPLFNDEATSGNSSTVVLGTIVCARLRFRNNQKVVFLSEGAASGTNPGLPHFNWNPIVYTANASGS